jgi:hypothetical protein
VEVTIGAASSRLIGFEGCDRTQLVAARNVSDRQSAVRVGGAPDDGSVVCAGWPVVAVG